MNILLTYCPGSTCDPCKPKPPPVDCVPSWPQGSSVSSTAPDGMSGSSTWTFPINITHPLCSSPHCVWTFNEWSNPFGSYPTGISFAWPKVGNPNVIQVSLTINPGGFSLSGQVTGQPFSATDNAYHGLLPAQAFVIAGIPSQLIAVVKYSGAGGIALGPEGVGYPVVYS